MTDRSGGSRPTALHPLRVLALVVVLLGVFAAPLAAAEGPSAGHPATADGDAANPASGAHLSGVVGVQDGLVRGTLAAETFEARLETAASARERADLIDRRLNETERQLDDLRTQVEDLAAAREAGSLDADAYTARLAAAGETAQRLRDVTNATVRAAADLPPQRRGALDIDRRVERIRARAGAVSDRASDASAAIDGTGQAVRARPITDDRVGALLDEATGTSASLRDLLGSARINVHIQRANGQVVVFGVRTADGRVAEVTVDPFEDAGVAVYTDYRTIGQIQRADDTAAEFEAALRDGRITYDGQGLGNSLRFGVVKLVSTVTGAVLWLVPALRRD